jgi:ubiquinone/menaquinone biosynthesis C-methylase UbiE
MQENKDVIQAWSESAPYWEKHREIIRAMFAPITQALIEAAEITSGNAVLDVAMGPGEPALTIAEVVGPDGRVVGTDAVAEMVEAAHREGVRRNLRNASFETALAEQLPFAANTFDAVVCRFGVMFFPSPLDGVREMLRVLKPGGKMALAVWHYAERNPFHSVVAQVVDRYVESPPLAADAPDAFRFAKPGELLRIVESAGLAAASETLLRFSIRAPLAVADYWTLRSEMSERLRSKLSSLSPVRLAELRQEVLDALGDYSPEGGVTFPGEVLIISGARAAASEISERQI